MDISKDLLSIVTTLSIRHADAWNDRRDLESVGNEALAEALQRFDPGRNTRVTSWVWTIVDQRIRRAKKNNYRKGSFCDLKDSKQWEEIAEIPGGSDYDNNYDREDVASYLETLSNDEYIVIALRYGLGPCDEHSLKDAGRVLGCAGETVRRLQKRALANMRKKACA